MEKLQMFKGDTAFIKGSKGHQSIAIVISEQMAVSAIKMNKSMRKNLGVDIRGE